MMKYVIAYQGSNHPGGSGWDIHSQVFGEDGEAQGAEFRLSSTINNSQRNMQSQHYQRWLYSNMASGYQDGDNENEYCDHL